MNTAIFPFLLKGPDDDVCNQQRQFFMLCFSLHLIVTKPRLQTKSVLESLRGYIGSRRTCPPCTKCSRTSDFTDFDAVFDIWRTFRKQAKRFGNLWEAGYQTSIARRRANHAEIGQDNLPLPTGKNKWRCKRFERPDEARIDLATNWNSVRNCYCAMFDGSESTGLGSAGNSPRRPGYPPHGDVSKTSRGYGGTEELSIAFEKENALQIRVLVCRQNLMTIGMILLGPPCKTPT